MTPERLNEFFACWNARDYERLAGFLTPDCVFHPSVGPEVVGRTVRGREAIKQLASSIWQLHPDGSYVDVRSFVAGPLAASEWQIEWPAADGSPQRIAGCDTFELDGELIARINGFRKVKAPAPDAS